LVPGLVFLIPAWVKAGFVLEAILAALRWLSKDYG
jgi:hypothetical protein